MVIKERPEGLDSPIVPKVMRLMSQANVWLYQKTDGRLGSTWRVGAAFPKGVPVCLLTTKGRKTGAPRTTPLLFIEEGPNIVLVASQGGLPKDPLWYLNLKNDPDVEIQVRARRGRYRARVADEAERSRLWPELVAHYADFAAYQTWTDRQIPVVICEPVAR
jgi:deazaflavin-dependent oxidoreductase (nitroreductase family)